MKKNLLLFNSMFYMACAFPQVPSIEWQKTYGGGPEGSAAQSIQQTVDGGYIVAGYSYNYNDSNCPGGYNYLVVKLDSTGIIQWQKYIGGSSVDRALSIQQTTDGGYIVAGGATSNDCDVTNNHGDWDYWVVKLDSTGIIQWQKCFGGSSFDVASSIQQTTDGGYIVAGWSYSDDGDVTNNHGSWDYWVVKLDSMGTIQWQKCFGGSSFDEASSIQQTVDGGYIVAGWTESSDGDVTNFRGPNGSDYWVVKIDSMGTIQWQKCFGGSHYDEASSIQQTTDGGYIVAGYTLSKDGDVTNNHGNTDYWIVKLDSTGMIEWQKCLGGSSGDWAESIQQTTDGGYIVAGFTGSIDGDVIGNHGRFDCWIVKLDSTGTIQWQKCLGGLSHDGAYSIQQTADGGYIVAGWTDFRNDNSTSINWIVKLGTSSLPIELINFNAIRNDNNAVLTWQTANEINSSHFNIERSLDGVHFNTIASIKAAGNSNSILNYSYTDSNIVKLNASKIYYRLQQIDRDGKSKLSRIIVLYISGIAFEMQILPNPTINELNVRIATNKAQSVQIVVSDAIGKKVIIDKRKLITGINNIFYNTALWAKGIYLIKVFMTDGSSKSIKVIKQ